MSKKDIRAVSQLLFFSKYQRMRHEIQFKLTEGIVMLLSKVNTIHELKFNLNFLT